MGLIKSADVPTKVQSFSMKDIEAAARNIILRAQQRAAQILAAARTEGEISKLQAHENGFAEGKLSGIDKGIEEGKQAGHAQALAENGAALQALISSLKQAAVEFEAGRDDLQTQGLSEVIGLACSIARRVTKQQGLIDQRVLLKNLRDAMTLVVHTADVRIAINPAQLATLQAELPALRIAWSKLKHLEIVGDDSITPGGARIYTNHGQIDADLDAQLDRVIAELNPLDQMLPPSIPQTMPAAAPPTPVGT